MFVVYALKEAWQTLSTHRFRTFAMGFGVAWAFFVLSLLLSLMHSGYRGIKQVFAKYGEKTMFIWENSKQGGTIPFEMAAYLAKQFEFIQAISPITWHFLPYATYRSKVMRHPPMIGVDGNYALLSNLKLQEGRFFSAYDATAMHRYCVIAPRVKNALFGQVSAVGQYILLENIAFQVIGVLDEEALSIEYNGILITNGLMQAYWPRVGACLCGIRLTLAPSVNEEIAEDQFLKYFSRQLQFDVQHQEAHCVSCFSVAKQTKPIHQFFEGLAMLVWVIGICFLITGVVGMSNMVLVTVQERTQEIAIRRILGVASMEIVAMFVWEILLVTLAAGIVGCLGSFACMQLVNKWIVPLYQSDYFLTELTCPAEWLGSGWCLILVTSCLVSIVPVARALRIKPIAAFNR